MSQYFPSLKNTVESAIVPENIITLNENIDLILSRLFVKNFTPVTGLKNSSKVYYLNILLNEKIGFNMPGIEGFSISINPSQTLPSYTELPVTFSTKVPFLNYLNQLKVSSFDWDSATIFKLILDFFGLEKQNLLEVLIFRIVDDDSQLSIDPFDNFVSQANQKISTNGTITYTPNDDDEQVIEDLISQIESLNFNLFDFIYQYFINDVDHNKIFENLYLLFYEKLGEFNYKSDLSKILKIDFDLSVNSLNLALEFPRTLLIPYDLDPQSPTYNQPNPDTNAKSKLTFIAGNLIFSTERGIRFENLSTFSFQKSQIADTGLYFEASDFRVDLSRTTNIPEADADGRPVDFMGVYIQDATIGFPATWQHNPNSTGEIRGRNLLIGTGGISGTLGLEAVTSGDPSPLLELQFGPSFAVSLDTFSVTFQQNSIINSSIKGILTIPGFKQGAEDAKVAIEASLGKDGDFIISAVLDQTLTAISIPNILDLNIYSLAVGKTNGKFHADIAGEVDFTVNVPNISTDFPKKLPMKLRVWENGKIEFDKGTLILPKAISLKVGPVTLAVTALHFGSAELQFEDKLRQYSFIGFDGGLNINPGGVDVKGNGVKLYYTTDDGVGKPSHRFIRISGIEIDIRIPGDAVSPDQAELLLKGFLSVKNKAVDDGVPTTEYAGGISFSVNKAKVTGAATMAYNPSTPSFLIDIGVQFPGSVPIGTTGLGLLALRGLMASGYRLNKADEEAWWKLYKRPIEGINYDKFNNDKGFAFGAGASIVTQPDGGKSFSSKLFLLLGLPDVFLLSGQGALLDEPVQLTDPDPPFSAMLAFSSKSIEAGFGVNYKMPKGSGLVESAIGDVQMAYFFNDASAWYVNVGRDFPEQERVKAQVLTLFESYAYLMISAQGIKFGAGSKFDFNKDYKVAKMSANFYKNLFAKVSFRPTQLGGGIDMGGSAYFSVAKFKLGLSLAAYLGADAFKPFKIAGGVKVSLNLPRPLRNKEVAVDFVWTFDNDRPTDPFKPIEPIEDKAPVKAINMLTGDDYDVNYTQAALTNTTSWIDKTIPLDSFIDVGFVHSVKTELEPDSALIFGEVTSPDFEPTIPPERGLTEPVKHQLKLKKVLIKAWDGSAWVDYNVYEGVSAIRSIPYVETQLNNNPDYLKTFPQGFWQAQTPNKNTNLRIMGQNMFSYLNSSTPGAIKLEYAGFKGGVVFCEEDKIQPICINWEDVNVDEGYSAETFINHKGITFKVIGADGAVKNYSAYNLTHGLNFTTAEGIEIYFNEPQGFVKPSVTVFSPNKLVVEYYKEAIEGYDINDNPVYVYSKIRTDIVEAANLSTYMGYDDADLPVKKVKISVDRIGQGMLNTNQTDDLLLGHYNYGLNNYWGGGMLGMVMDDVVLIGRALPATEITDLRINNNAGTNIIGHWELNGNANDSSGNAHNGTFVPSTKPYSFLAPDRNNNTNSTYYFQPTSSTSYNNSHIIIPHSNDLSVGRDNFTIACWVQFPYSDPFKKTVGNGRRVLLSKRGAWGGFELTVTSNANFFNPTQPGNLYAEWLNFTFSDENATTNTTNFSIQNNVSYPNFLLNDGKWHFVAVTVNFDTSESYIYIDDVIANKAPFYRPAQSPTNNNAYLHQLCLLSEKQSKYNQNIPSQSQLTAENTKMADGLTKLFQPIWRPNTYYAIEITTSDNVDNGGETNNQFTIGFKTAGPIGYFQDLDTRYTNLTEDDKDKYQLANLKHYINYNRSFPNAEGKLLNNKPIFYKEPNLHLFFNYPYINAMYSPWGAYQGVPTSDYSLKLYVADPLNEQQNASALQGTWVQGKLVVETEDVRMLNSLISNGSNCSGIIGPLEKLAYNAKYQLPDLRPSTLYTAIYNSVYGSTKENVHQHVFVTSKYATFKEQIESYLLGNNLKAIFDVSREFTTAEITKASDIVIDNVNQDIDLVKKFADKYDRVIDGVLNKINPLEAATTTEFNIIRNSNTLKVIGVLVRNPEPIINPQLPDADLLNSITTINNLQAGGTESNYLYIYSKDRSAVFITKTNLEIPLGVLDITFKYLEYNGTAYVLKDPQAENEITIQITIANLN